MILGMRKILLINDNTALLSTLTIEIKKHTYDVEVLVAKTYKEANNITRQHQNKISAAIVDVTLSDCKYGQAAILTSSQNIPTIILVDDINNKSLKSISSKKNILEFIDIHNPNAISYAINFVKKILRNHQKNILLVDDSALFRQAFRRDLQKLQFNVIEAEDGNEALDIMLSAQGKSISVVLVDYNMPNMDGVTLTMKLRKKYQKDILSIIAISATDNEQILVDFIKAGANDFIYKPHKFEELDVRINASLDILDLFKEAKHLAHRDFLTEAYNRRYFFEASKAIINRNIRKHTPVAVATIDIDNFKSINDLYGHDIGDIAIKEVVAILNKSLRKSDLIARFGGDEFCVLLEDITLKNTEQIFEKLRKNFKFNEIILKEIVIDLTVSIGISFGKSSSIDHMLKISDEALYDAKSTGKDKIVVHAVNEE